MRRIAITSLALLLGLVGPVLADESIQLANNPSLSPDGSQLAIDYNGDVWIVPTAGGTARQLTQNPARDRQPKWSPDGSEIAFISERDGTPQVYVIPVAGGTPTRLTMHTAGYALEGWTPDGTQLLVSGNRDQYWYARQATRFFLIPRDGKSGEQLVFDDYGKAGQLSPDGRKLLFVREGPDWWRKGYYGSQAGQVWQYDLDSKAFKKVCTPDRGATAGLWKPDGSGCYVVSAKDGTFNLYEHTLATGTEKQLTKFLDDSVVQPCISKDGKSIVFRHLFDFYRYQPGTSNPPQKIAINVTGDRPNDRKDRRVLATASDASFSADGLEIALIAGGDLWVMDTELREPRQISTSCEEEREPNFSPDGHSIYFISDMHGECNLWRAERADKAKYWWQNREFKLVRLTQDKSVKSNMKLSPDGSKIAFCRDRGDLWVMDADGSNGKRVLQSFQSPEYDWSPDGKWLVYATDDNDFNRDVWVMPLDGSKPAFNLSRSPFSDHFPTWSPDGKAIAFVGRRGPEEVDIHYVFLKPEDDQVSSREKAVEKAVEKMNRVRQPISRESLAAAPAPGTPKPAPGPVVIDFNGIHDRIRSISIPDSSESGLFWSPDGKRLGFSGSVDGKPGTYVVDIPDDPRPKALNSGIGRGAKWLKNGTVVWLVAGTPSSFAAGGGSASPGGGGRQLPANLAARLGLPSTPTPAAPAAPTDTGTQYRFSAIQEFDRSQKNAAVFELAWRTMRDNFYDGNLNNREWDAIRMKYLDAATISPDAATLTTVVTMMLGELNGSHLGFFANDNLPASLARRRGGPSADPEGPSPVDATWHLGIRFDATFAGPGLKVRDAIPGGPADKVKTRIAAGEVVLSIDGQSVDRTTNLTKLLNAPAGKEFSLIVAAADSKERPVTIRPTSYAEVRSALYKKWMDDNRAAVDKLSGGKLGYLHIEGMVMPSFYKFQLELYSAGAGKDGLVIDVRENGGGDTADRLLTALTQPIHAYTVPRDGGTGYPQDRKVYATWNKPIVVLCNQNSFSNAEIFSHAVKMLKRGQLVGVPTAGGVISTGAAPIMDVGVLRLPFRGWYSAADGQDMELNGAMPDHVLWHEPGQMPAGKDVQLEKAVSVLSADVNIWKSKPLPKFQKASERGNRSDQPVVRDGE